MATEKKSTKKPTAAEAPAQVKPSGDEKNSLQKRKTVIGYVASDKMAKTIVVKVDRRVRHGLYQKYVTKSVRYKAHDENNDAKLGDLVRLVETRPISRDKRWALQEIVRRAGQAPEANV